MRWKEFQSEVTELFRSVGCSSEEDMIVSGVRGEHKIDVYVKFRAFSLECTWIVECKYWNSNVTKEKVLALQTIVQDVGADKGVLVSRKGFQSGAVRCAQKSNIILANIDELREYIDDEIRATGWEALTRRVQYLSMRLMNRNRDELNYGDIGHVSIIDMKIRDALFGTGQMVLIRSMDETAKEVFVEHEKPEQFIAHANRLLDEVQQRNNIPLTTCDG